MEILAQMPLDEDLLTLICAIVKKDEGKEMYLSMNNLEFAYGQTELDGQNQ